MPGEDHVHRLNAALEGRYVVQRRLGEGGMATVYLADDVRHGRGVALKVLKPELAAVVGADRFLAEIRTTANLQHPNILPLFDSGEADGFLFYVMPFVEGETLRDRLDRQHQLPVDEAVRLAQDVAEALEYAHSRGVIHRDIKPANILLQSGRPVVADFGIALAVGAAGGGRLTETGLSLGTPHYMSPEQATGDLHVGPASDVYALGCVLYEMLAGEPPYTGSSLQSILGRILTTEATPVTELRSSVPLHVDAAIRRALEKVPADRFTTARDFSTALAQPGFRHADAGMAPAASVPGREWKLATVGLAAALAAVSGWAALRPDPSAPVVRSVVPLPADVSLPTAYGTAFDVSADGTRIVFAGTSGEETRLWHRPLADLVASPVPGTEGARTPALSPEGGSVAFVSEGRLMVASLTGAPPLTLIDGGLAGGAGGVAWSDDGWLYFRLAGETGLRRLRADGSGEPEALSDEGRQAGDPGPIPGGRGLLFTRSTSGTGSEIVLLDLEDRTERVLFEGRSARYLAGHVVYTSTDGALLSVPFDADRLEVTGGPSALLAGVETTPLAGSQFAVSTNGTLVYLEGGATAGLALAEVDLEGNRRLLPLERGDFSRRGPAWAPDGATVAFARDAQIYTYDTRLNTTPRQITFEGLNVSPVFSPDGRRIVFSSPRDGALGPDLFVKNLDDDAPARLLLAMPGAQFATQWPADTLLLFENAVDRGVREFWMLDPTDPEPLEPRLYLRSQVEIGDVLVSPDGRLAAYRSFESGQEEAWLRSFPEPGVPTAVSRGGGGIPYWSPDGRTLYYATRLGRWFVAARLDRSTLTPSVLSIDSLFGDPGLGQAPPAGAALHPDGDRFILALYPDATSGSGRLVLVQNFLEELSRASPTR